jgi:hypothetical protein
MYAIIFLLTAAVVFVVTRYVCLRRAEKRITEYFHTSIIRHSNEVENIYKQMRGWKHDYHNHIQVLKAHLSMGEITETENYLDGLETDLRERISCGVWEKSVCRIFGTLFKK